MIRVTVLEVFGRWEGDKYNFNTVCVCVCVDRVCVFGAIIYRCCGPSII